MWEYYQCNTLLLPWAGGEGPTGREMDHAFRAAAKFVLIINVASSHASIFGWTAKSAPCRNFSRPCMTAFNQYVLFADDLREEVQLKERQRQAAL